MNILDNIRNLMIESKNLIIKKNCVTFLMLETFSGIFYFS